MRIVVVQDYLRNGGTEKHSVFLANFFEHEGHGCTLLTFRPKGRLASQVQARHIPLQRLDSGLDHWAPFLQSRLRSLRPDVVLLMGRAANEKLPQVKAALPDVPVVASLRTGAPLSAAYRAALAAADAVVANSRWALGHVAALGIPKERLRCIYNGFGRHWNLAQRDAARAHIRVELGVVDNELVLINIAGFRSGRGQERLLEALALWQKSSPPPWRLWLLGEGPQMERVRTRTAELGLDKQVMFLGFCAHTFEYICGADVCVFASERESQPNSLIEAQWAGLPVVSYAVGGAGECFLPEKSGYLIPDGDASAFVAALDRLAADSALRQQMGEAGAAYAREHFDTVRQARKYLDLFKSLISV